mmetsp:Transcript_90565/g.194205  ORF Transcript_90565/g.194205 Transcript_90565/m.194205 type:complete len:204 (-) Transcript_90565:67-678(-)
MGAELSQSLALVPRREPVILHIYDLGTSGQFMALNALLKAVGTGAFHVGVEVYGREWSYRGTSVAGTGIVSCRPKKCGEHTYYTSVQMGYTDLSQDEVLLLLNGLRKIWRGEHYEMLTHNCTHFADNFTRELGVGNIPYWTMNLAGAGSTVESVYRVAGDVMVDTGSRLYGVTDSLASLTVGAILAPGTLLVQCVAGRGKGSR